MKNGNIQDAGGIKRVLIGIECMKRWSEVNKEMKEIAPLYKVIDGQAKWWCGVSGCRNFLARVLNTKDVAPSEHPYRPGTAVDRRLRYMPDPAQMGRGPIATVVERIAKNGVLFLELPQNYDVLSIRKGPGLDGEGIRVYGPGEWTQRPLARSVVERQKSFNLMSQSWAREDLPKREEEANMLDSSEERATVQLFTRHLPIYIKCRCGRAVHLICALRGIPA